MRPPVQYRGEKKHDLAKRVSGALESEPTVLAPRRKRAGDRGLARQLAGFAIAASITAVATAR